MIKHTHWLYGFGPDKEVKFNTPIKVEDDCVKCLHNKVCNRSMDKRCENYEFGSSSDLNCCQSCIHKYTRYDKDKIPCFKCKDFLPIKNNIN